jgi:hypothetical protein
MNLQRTTLRFQNPQGYAVECELLQEFEDGLDPLNPQTNSIPCHILGYGEISTVFGIDTEGLRDLAFKRMCIFKSQEEAQVYLDHYIEYNHRLESEIGLHLPPYGYALLVCNAARPVFYIIQKRLLPASIGNQAIYWLAPQEITLLFQLTLRELLKVWQYNQSHPGAKVGIDGQISNWAIADFDPRHPSLDETVALYYLDTSSPLFLQGGVEQLDPELFLRSAPPYLVWILRWLFVKDVMTRYYNPRKVTIDLIANFYKEQRPELVPGLVAAANEHFTTAAAQLGISDISVKEVKDYYREDEIIWSLYLSFRQFDRFLRRKVLRREYPYILPGKIRR